MNAAPSSYDRPALSYAQALLTTRTKPQSTKRLSKNDPKKKGFLDLPLGECDRKELLLPDARQDVCCFVAEIGLRFYHRLLVRRGAELIVKAARIAVNAATLSVESVFYNHDMNKRTQSTHDQQYLGEKFATYNYFCDHDTLEQHLEDLSAPPFRCVSYRASIYIPWCSDPKHNAISLVNAKEITSLSLASSDAAISQNAFRPSLALLSFTFPFYRN